MIAASIVLCNQMASRWPCRSTANSSKRRVASSTTSTNCSSASSSRSDSSCRTRNRHGVCSANGAAAGSVAASVVPRRRRRRRWRRRRWRRRRPRPAASSRTSTPPVRAGARPASASAASWAKCGAPTATNRDPARTCTSFEIRRPDSAFRPPFRRRFAAIAAAAADPLASCRPHEIDQYTFPNQSSSHWMGPPSRSDWPMNGTPRRRQPKSITKR